ncbi:hypothetical protein BBP40_011717 [Aspergillus hancockii]|nr:hypothetical protein BBP40_011717 [Aspergillus hancockii]
MPRIKFKFQQQQSTRYRSILYIYHISYILGAQLTLTNAEPFPGYDPTGASPKSSTSNSMANPAPKSNRASGSSTSTKGAPGSGSRQSGGSSSNMPAGGDPYDDVDIDESESVAGTPTTQTSRGNTQGQNYQSYGQGGGSMGGQGGQAGVHGGAQGGQGGAQGGAH